jgi:hypothetical protein
VHDGRVRPLIAFIVAAVMLIAASSALADEGEPAWRATTPRAEVMRIGDTFTLRVPDERAWGVASSALSLVPGRAYRARVELDVHDPAVRGAFLRAALYARRDGRGRQRRWYDTPLVAGESRRVDVVFIAPRWARTAKLRVLIRADDDMAQPVHASQPMLVPLGLPPPVVLKPDR